jgi:hypothetical protein
MLILTVVEAWVVPEAPLMVTVTGLGAVGLESAGVEALLPPPPHELNRSTAQIRELSASARSARFRLIPPIKTDPITAKLRMYGLKGRFLRFDGGSLIEAKAVLVEKVRTEDTVVEPGVTTAGEKEQVSPTGGFEQESDTALSNDPDVEATAMLEVAPLPGVRLTDAGEAARVILAAAGAGGGVGGTGQLGA